MCVVRVLSGLVSLEVEASLPELSQISSWIRFGGKLIHILIVRMSSLCKREKILTIATNALRRVDQIDIESAIFAFGSVCLECIERAARTVISL
jgi:hypothetical protein